MSARGGNYLLTWTTHGTWLPGDERGFVGRVPVHGERIIRNQVGSEPFADMPALEQAASARSAGARVVLSDPQARFCHAVFEDSAQRHGLRVVAGAIMRTHVHLVVLSPEAEGARLLNLFKGASARRLTQEFGAPEAIQWWTRSGSRRLLTDRASFEGAVRYVRDQDGWIELWGDF